MSDADPAYIAVCEHGRAIAATVDRPEHAKYVAKDLSDWVKRGYAIERTTVGEARPRLMCDDCEKVWKAEREAKEKRKRKPAAPGQAELVA